MPSPVQLVKLKARARIKVRRKKEKALKDRESLLQDLEGRFRQPVDGVQGTKGKDGRDAPTLEDILQGVLPKLPTPRIEQTTVEKTILEKLDTGEVQDIVQVMLDAQLPKMAQELRPKVELIREEIDFNSEDFVQKKEFDSALIRIQEAITYHSGGGAPPDVTSLVNLITADQATNIIQLEDLEITKINIVFATVKDSTIQLPAITPNYVVWVEDAVLDGGNITITREG